MPLAVGTTRGLVAVVLVAIATVLVGCTPWPCVDDTIASSSAPDAGFVATVVRRNCGSTTPIVVRFYVKETATGGTHELFKMSGPFTAKLVWKEPRLLHAIVTDYLGDKTGSWMDTIETQIAAHRDIKFGDLHVVVGSPRQFGLVPAQ